jgi:ABC-type amino acid transport substrate-binding protein
MISKFYSLVLFLMFLCMGSVAFAHEESDKILSVGISADYPPFEFIENEKIVGFDVDLANKIAKKLGRELQIQDMKFASIISAVQTGRVDFGISSFTITPKRKKNIDFSIKYYIPKFAMIYRKDTPIVSLKDFNKKIIAAQIGSTMENFLQDKLEAVKDFKLISLAKNPFMVEELKFGRVDGVLVEESQAKAFVKKYSNIMTYSLFGDGGYGYAIALKKGSSLKPKIDSVIRSLKKSGELKKLEKKWLTK